MFFCGVNSKFEVGDKVIARDGNTYVVDGIGILGSKLSIWAFLYKIIPVNGDNRAISVTEDNIKKI